MIDLVAKNKYLYIILILLIQLCINGCNKEKEKEPEKLFIPDAFKYLMKYEGNETLIFVDSANVYDTIMFLPLGKTVKFKPYYDNTTLEKNIFKYKDPVSKDQIELLYSWFYISQDNYFKVHIGFYQQNIDSSGGVISKSDFTLFPYTEDFNYQNTLIDSVQCYTGNHYYYTNVLAIEFWHESAWGNYFFPWVEGLWFSQEEGIMKIVYFNKTLVLVDVKYLANEN